jgi:hypothetical protein
MLVGGPGILMVRRWQLDERRITDLTFLLHLYAAICARLHADNSISARLQRDRLSLVSQVGTLLHGINCDTTNFELLAWCYGRTAVPYGADD